MTAVWCKATTRSSRLIKSIRTPCGYLMKKSNLGKVHTPLIGSSETIVASVRVSQRGWEGPRTRGTRVAFTISIHRYELSSELANKTNCSVPRSMELQRPLLSTCTRSGMLCMACKCGTGCVQRQIWLLALATLAIQARCPHRM